MDGNGAEQRNESIRPQVMLVDDEECIRETVRELLESEGIGILTANGANECLCFLRSGFRGVILMDVMMPEMDGWATIRAIEKEGLLQGNVISMLTALEAPDERMDGLQEYVVDYITKPFSPDSFVAAIRKYLVFLNQLPRVC